VGDGILHPIKQACHNVPPVMLELVQRFQAFLQTSAFPVRNQLEDSGFWHGFLLRCTWKEPQQCMAMAIVNPKGISDEDKAAEYEKMKAALPVGNIVGTTASLESLFVQEYSGNSNPDVNTPCTLLAGVPTLSETLCGMTFKLSPQSFFQVNTLGAERLYETVGRLALGSDSVLDTTLLDVCCGTGTIGLTLAKRVKQVIGVEICEPAVLDARANAIENHVANATFIAGPAEAVLPSVTSSASGPVLAIVDPPRSGLSMSVIKTLRACKGIQRLVYVSCNPTGTFVEDAVK
jgi:tRNA (uracil-5-)-methyltransferase